MELFMNVLQYFAGVLFVVCLLGFIGVYMVFLYKLANEVGRKMYNLSTELYTKVVGA
jgi:hypothetical protein